MAAVRGLRIGSWLETVQRLSGVVGSEPDCLNQVVQMIESTIEKESALLPQNAPQHQQPPAVPLTPPHTPKHQPQQPMEFFDGNETPTDIMDVTF